MTKAKELAEWLKSRVEELTANDDSTCYKFALDDKLAIYLGWEEGFNSDDEFAIHSKSQPTYCICVRVAENLGCWGDIGDAYMPWYKDEVGLFGGEVYDTDTSIRPNEDYNIVARYLLNDYETIKSELEKGLLTFGE